MIDVPKECESIRECYTEYHLTNPLNPMCDGRGAGGGARLSDNHLMALRLIEFEIVVPGPIISNIFKFSRYGVRVGGWNDLIKIICIFANFIRGI